MTRQKLLEAALDSLAAVGYSATTVAVVAARAGVSRGAAQHHFPTRADLFAAAVEYMTEVRLAEIRQQATALPSGAGRTEAIVGLLADVYAGPLFRAALHLWVAASTEEPLRQQIVRLESHVGRQAHRTLLEVLEVSERTPVSARPCRASSTWPAASAWPTCSPTTAPAAAAWSADGQDPHRALAR